MDALTAKYTIKRYYNGEFSNTADEILKEFVLSIYLGGNILVKLICIPEQLEELALGYLYSEGFISSIEDVDSIEFEDAAAYIEISKSAKRNGGNGEASATNINYTNPQKWDVDMVTTDSGDIISVSHGYKRSLSAKAFEKTIFDPAVILKNANILLDKSEIFKKTGNVHSVMICRGEEVLYFSEDIGRYNALDKCVGGAIMNKTDLSGACLYTSGRIPSSIARKVIKAGIPIIVSRSAPTDLTLKIAAEFGLTVVGFAKGDRFNLYT